MWQGIDFTVWSEIQTVLAKHLAQGECATLTAEEKAALNEALRAARAALAPAVPILAAARDRFAGR